MHIKLTEPVCPRYIHINPATNQVHLLVPVVGGQEISTDNTCMAKSALREFFYDGALRELNAYKISLVFDIGLLAVDDPRRKDKASRLAQIEIYIKAISLMTHNWEDALQVLLNKSSNLYGIQLRPRAQDSSSKVVNPVFNINRTNDASGTPLSALYNAMYRMFPDVVIAIPDRRTQLIHAVLEALPASASFEEIKCVLIEQTSLLFGLTIDFDRCSDGTSATKETIDTIMGFGADVPPRYYVESLLGACANNMWEMLPTPSFYSIPTEISKERTERLSILTQFFLANLNVYCKAKGVSSKNFGVILDASDALSTELVHVVVAALNGGGDVEKEIFAFFNANLDRFGFSRALSADDLSIFVQKFERNYRTITATKENPHMDDFMLLDLEATEEMADYVTHQGSICINFFNIMIPFAASINPDYFACVRDDFVKHTPIIPHRNEFVVCELDLNQETLSDEQLKSLAYVFYVACERGDLGVVKELLSSWKNINVNLVFHDGFTALYIACQQGRLKIVKELLRSCKNINVNVVTSTGASPLFIACRNGYLEIVKELLRSCKNIDVGLALSIANNATALSIACEKGYSEIVKALLSSSKNIDVNLPISNGVTPLYIACHQGYLKVVKELLILGKNIDINLTACNGTSPLYVACERGHLEIVKELLRSDKNIDVNLISSEGATALYIACQKGHLEIVEELLSSGKNIDVNLALPSGATPLYIACQNGHLGIVNALLSPGQEVRVDVNRIGRENHTSLQCACLSPANKNNNALFKRLLQHPSILKSLYNKNSYKQTALDIAFKQNNQAAIEELLEYSCKNHLNVKHIMSERTVECAKSWAKKHSGNINIYDYLSMKPSSPSIYLNHSILLHQKPSFLSEQDNLNSDGREYSKTEKEMYFI